LPAGRPGSRRRRCRLHPAELAIRVSCCPRQRAGALDAGPRSARL